MRRLESRDVAGAMRLVEAADWNQTEEDWGRLLAWAPESCWGMFAGEELVATTTAVRYSTGVVWVGMVLTDVEWRGRGLATRLVEETLRMEAACFRLDATAMGAPLYRKLGFVDERPIERWERVGTPGYDPRLLAGSWAVGRPGRKAWYFGPWVGEGLENALQMTVAGRGGQAMYWDLFPEDREAVAIAERYGFRRVRELVRMRRGAAVPDVQARAICGFEWG